MRAILLVLPVILFLTFTGDSDAIDPWNIQDNIAVPVSESNSWSTFGQTFVAHYPRTSAVQVLWVVSAEVNALGDGRAILHLRRHPDDTDDIRTASVALSEIRHNSFTKFAFAPIQDSQNQSFYFFVQVLQPEGSRGLSLWSSEEDVYPEGQMYLDGRVIAQDLAFRVYYQPDLWMLLQAWIGMVQQNARGIAFGILVFLIPGLGLMLGAGPLYTTHPIQKLAMAGGLSLAFLSAGSILFLLRAVLAGPWIVLAFVLALALFIGGLLLWFYRRRSGLANSIPEHVSVNARNMRESQVSSFFPWLLGGLTVLSMSVGLLQIRDFPVPLWVDSPVHAGYIKVLLDRGSLPADSFYHFGYHGIVAFVVQVAGISISQAMLLVGQLLITQVGLGVSLLSHRLTGSWVAALISAMTIWFFSPTPAYFVTWGRYPLLLGAAILPVALLFAIHLIEKQTLDDRTLFLAVVSCAGLAFSQIRLTVFYALFVVTYLVYTCGRNSSSRPDFGKWGARLGLGGGAILLFGAGWLTILLARGVDWQSIVAQNAAAPSIDLSTAATVALSHRGTELVALALGGLIIGGISRSRVTVLVGLWYTSLSAIAILWSSAISISLVILMGLVPVALLVGDLGRVLMIRMGNALSARAGLLLAGGIVVSLLGAREMVSLVNPATVLFTDADRQAIEWIQANTPSHARFLVNSFAWFDATYVPSDGGSWIAVLTNRATVFIPHAVADEKILGQWIPSQSVQYIFLGRRGGTLKPQFFEYQPEHYTLVYNTDGIRIFEVSRD